jgi:tetratricopeptide (TPR) repeat protein
MAKGSDSGFIGGVAQNVAAGICTGLAAAACFKLGLASSGDIADPRNWPIYLVLFVFFLLLGPFGHGLQRQSQYVRLWVTSRRLRRLGANRLTVLIGEFHGNTSEAIKDRIQVELNTVFGKAADRPFAAQEFPLSLFTPRTDSEPEVAKLIRRGQRWLKRSHADLFIWGRALNDLHATIYFLKNVGGLNDEKEKSPLSPIEIYKFDLNPTKFGKDAAESIALAALMSVRPVFNDEYVRKLKAERALELISKLQPFVGRSIPGFPENLLEEIREAHVSALQGLGRQGIISGWDRAFAVLEERLTSKDKDDFPVEWAHAASELAKAHLQAGEQFGIISSLDRAVVLFSEITEILPSQNRTERALAEVHLGMATLAKGTTHDFRCCGQAIAAFSRAKTKLNKNLEPEDFAMAAAGICSAVAGLNPMKAEKIKEHIAACKEELMTLDLSPMPLCRARVYLALASATRGLGAATVDKEMIRDSLSLYKDALASTNELRAAHCLEHEALRITGNALTEYARAIYWLVFLGDKEIGIDEAIDLLRDAIALLPADQMPIDRARAQIRLSEAIIEQGRFGDSERAALEAISVLRNVTNSTLRLKAPLVWFEAADLLGELLQHEATRRNDPAIFEEAIEILRKALRESSNLDRSDKRANLKRHLAEALIKLSEVTNNATLLNDAINYAKDSLLGCTRELNALVWARGQTALGEANLLIGGLKNTQGPILKSIIYFTRAQQVFTRESGTHIWAMLEIFKGDCYFSLAQMRLRAAHIKEAEQLYNSALVAFTELGAISEIDWAKQRLKERLGAFPTAH